MVRVDTKPALKTTPIPQSARVQLPSGATVQDALNKMGARIGEFDRVEPSSYTILKDGTKIIIFQRQEIYDVKEAAIPYEQQTVRSMNLPVGDIRMIQAGENGTEEITFRRVYEGNVEISNNQIKSVVVKEPVSQILMTGSQIPFTPFDIPGILAYISGGNAWVMEGSTSKRRPLVMNGKLDGRVFSLSPDGSWLLFSQRVQEKEKINSLFVVRTDGISKDPLALQVDNIIQFAGWVPGSNLRIAFSSVEPRTAAPGWQANNDLYLLDFSANGWVSKRVQVLSSNAGGVYGWWGTNFLFSPDGSKLLYVRPDEIGIVDVIEGKQLPLVKITPLQTQADWAWVPGVSWNPDGGMLYTVTHKAQATAELAETSTVFDLAAVLLDGTTVPIVSQAGMFAYPIPSPVQALSTGENAYQLAYLQAIFANQSQTSRYRLVVSDRDGSNKKVIFPTEGMLGLDPQQVIWSPQALTGKKEGKAILTNASVTGYVVAFIYQKDIWFGDVDTGIARQVSGENSVTKIDWR